MRLILASTSRYRAELLGRLRIEFDQVALAVDETARSREDATQLARRLALDKSQAVSRLHPDAWVIGSDQVASCEGRLLGKPGTNDAACTQLESMSGRYAAFTTAIALTRGSDPQVLQAMDVTVVKLRKLSAAEIERYVQAEQPLDCAGSFKVEGLGISLFAEVQSRDPTALIGLPLIETARLLRKAGYALP